MEIGERLKEARETQNLSLDSLQETTKIQKRYLIAIEEGNLQILPGKFYARAFIKEYATAVGLDPNELLEEHKEEVPKTEDENNLQYTRIQRTRKENNAEKSPAIFSLMPTIIVVLLVIGIFLVAWFFIQEVMSNDGSEPVEEPNDNIEIINPDGESGNDGEGTEDNTEDTENVNDSSSEENQEDNETEEAEPEFSTVEEGTGSTPESILDFNNAGEEISVRVESNGDSWLDIENDSGEVFYNGMFSEEDDPIEADLNSDERILFNVGNTPAVQISINGVELDYPVNADDFVHQRIWVNINSESE
ncbi:RodZ domain-containing protein [Virgibacillus ainsalahensis]